MTSAVPTLNIIGCGKAARVVVRRWVDNRLVKVLGVANRTVDSARQAVEFLGEGVPVAEWISLSPAELLLIGVGDQELPAVAGLLADFPHLLEGSVVFHLSGCRESTILAPLRALGAKVASLHPIMTFADPARAVDQLAGCTYTLEGDQEACELLRTLTEKAGGQPRVIPPDKKPLYHAALVFACNYLCVLLEKAFTILEVTGFSRDEAVVALRPIVTTALENSLRLGPTAALTGPVARGDVDVVKKEIETLAQANEDWALLYRTLAREALKMVPRQELTPESKWHLLADLLEEFPRDG